MSANLPARARVYIEGSSRPLHVVEEADVLVDEWWAENVVRFTNTSGERVAMRGEQIISIVAIPEPVADPDALIGKGVHVSGLLASKASVLGITGDAYHGALVLVEAEDLARADVLVFDAITNEIVWVDAAVPAAAHEHYAAAARACVKAVLIDTEAAV